MIQEVPESKVYISGVSAKITSRCNFRCGHCALGEHDTKYRMDMSPEDIEIVMEKATGPFLGSITLYGGEPRVNRQLPQILDTIGNHVHQSGKKLKIESERPDEELEHFRQERNDFLDSLSREKRERMQENGELRAILERRFLDSGLTDRVPISVEVFTNGFGMRSPETVAQIAEELAGRGVDQITVSLDLPHRQFVEEHNIPLDYTFLEQVTDLSKTKKVKREAGIPEGVRFASAGNAQYVIPVGRARHLSWQERVAMAGKGDENKEKVEAKVVLIQEELKEEFDEWPERYLNSHMCYCSPARLRRNFNAVEALAPENRIQKAGMMVEPNLDINPCGFSILPPIGNLREQSVDEIYQAAVDSELYRIIDEEGPQGLARRLTSRSEKELRAVFVERTPCGLCEDTVREHPNEVNAMLKARTV